MSEEIKQKKETHEKETIEAIQIILNTLNQQLENATNAGIQVTLKLSTIRRTGDMADRVTVSLEGATKQLYTPLIIRPN